MTFTIELDVESDRHRIAGILELPGVMVYGRTRAEAIATVKAHALRADSGRYNGRDFRLTDVYGNVVKQAVG
jgi:hypothetical protein